MKTAVIGAGGDQGAVGLDTDDMFDAGADGDNVGPLHGCVLVAVIDAVDPDTAGLTKAYGE